ncbi:MAG: 2-oxo acid dehydrogenase subunit E2, partial [Deltaproteobacteria bacterium]|nr:2-oxo acid dehydrogenase subunit E2 [Deltaproteobacteria bacterium]
KGKKIKTHTLESKEASSEKNLQSSPIPSSPELPPRASPYVRKLAREAGIDLKTIQGSGSGGRITEEDLKQSKPSTSTGPSHSLPIQDPHQEDFSQYGPIEEETLKSIRRKISDHLLQAMQHTVMVTHMDEALVDELIKIRKQKADYAKEKGVKLTLLPFLMKACALSLKDYPALNASLVNDKIYYKKYYHFGFAVDTEAGLMVPVIRNVDQKSILTLAKELTELSTKTRERKIESQDLKGSSFSITNIGSLGGRAFTPILNYPDSAILGLGRAYQKAIVNQEGQIKAAWVLPLCLTFDHRITDGATAARFTNKVIQYLQDPDLLLLDEGV